jgi:two-component system, OmpR family, sensor histidine kinase KdpD
MIKLTMMRSLVRHNWIENALALGAVAFVVIVFKLIITGVNATTVALCLILVVQIAASLRGLGPGILASIAGVLSFNFFFLPPTGTLTIEDPQNWIALSAFLITAIIASKLSSAARSRAYEAERRREEVWRLYQLGRAIIATPDSETVTSSIARQVVEIFELKYCSISVPDEGGKLRKLATADMAGVVLPGKGAIESAFRSGELIIDSTSFVTDSTSIVAYAPLKVGIRPTGVMVLICDGLERGVVEAIAGLVALALERARFLQEVSRTEALRQSDELKSALLASVSHNLRTPLTSIRASIDSLLREDFDWDKATLREFHMIISEETQRLTRLVEHLLEMARIEAGEIHPLKQWSAVSEIFSNAMEKSSALMRDRQVVAGLDETLPAVRVDSQLLAEVLSNLLENAAKYSPAATNIKVKGSVEGGQLIMSVSDEGPGVAADELERIFDKFYRGEHPSKERVQGTGMGLAIARGIIEVHGGRIWVENNSGHGSTFSFAIPVETRDVSELLPIDGEI